MGGSGGILTLKATICPAAVPTALLQVEVQASEQVALLEEPAPTLLSHWAAASP